MGSFECYRTSQLRIVIPTQKSPKQPTHCRRADQTCESAFIAPAPAALRSGCEYAARQARERQRLQPHVAGAPQGREEQAFAPEQRGLDLAHVLNIEVDARLIGDHASRIDPQRLSGRELAFQDGAAGVHEHHAVAVELLHDETLAAEETRTQASLEGDPQRHAACGAKKGIALRDQHGARRAPAAAASAKASAPAKPARADRFDASPVIARPALGSGVIRVPSTMKQGRDSIARLIVSPEDLATLLKDREVTRGDADVRETRENVHLTPRMRARLGGAGFSIEPKDFQDQAVKQGEPTVWVWTVVPEEAGSHTLVFTLEGLIVVDRKEVPIRPPALTAPVEVDVNPMYFVERHWQWLLTAIVLPVVGFLGKRWFDRRAVTPAPHG